MSFSLSLRWRLTIGYALVFATTVAFGALGVYLATQTTLETSLNAGLRDTASVALGNIDDPPAPPRFTPDLKPSSDLTVELLDIGGQLLDKVGRTESTTPALVEGFATTQMRRWYTVRTPERLWLRVSRSNETLTRLLEALARVLTLGSGLMVAVACGLGYWLADRALRPVDTVARTADRIANQGNFAERVPVVRGQDEMARLTNTVNAMLERLERTIEREKGFARAAAHELRTPLTTIKGRLDLALERPREAHEYQRHLGSMRERVNDLTALVDQLDLLAKADAAIRLEPVAAHELVPEVVDTVSAQFAASGKTLSVNLWPATLTAEAAGFRQVLGNLLENARKYGGPLVTVNVQDHWLEVRDNGRGPAPEAWFQLLRPFERGQNVQHVTGSGLGLPLVAALVARWNARLEPIWDEQGFAVRIVWPQT